MNETQQRLIRCFGIVFPAIPERSIPQASKAAVAAWDSVATVVLINVVEEEFGIQIDLEDVERLQSFEQFLSYLVTRDGDG